MSFRFYFLFFFSICSCATLFSSSSDTINFTSEPVGADVYLNGQKIGKTPLSYQVDRETFRQSEVVVKYPGYETKSFLLGRTLAAASLFNFTCLPSWLTDATSGNVIEYSPRAYFIDLRKEKTAKLEIKRSYFVMINHKYLMNDLARGEGEYLDTYLQLTNLSDNKIQTLKKKLIKKAPIYLSYLWPHQLYNSLESELNVF